MNKKFIIAYLICASPIFLLAQDISGFWKGTLDMNRGCFTNNNIELQITRKGDSIFGSSYHYLDIDNYVKKTFSGRYDSMAKKIILQEAVVTTFKIPFQCKICIKEYDLIYSGNNSQETLKGDWTSLPVGNFTNCDGGPITLTRIKTSAFAEIPEIIVDTGE